MRVPNRLITPFISLSVLLAPVAPAFAAPTRSEPVRRVILASTVAKAVIVEAKADQAFWYERCYLPGDAGTSLNQQLAKAAYRTCVRFSQPMTDNDAVRGEFNRQFSESVNDQFERYGRRAGNTMVVLSTIGGALIGGILPLLKIKYLKPLRSTSFSRMVATGSVTGLLAMIVTGWYSVEYADEFGLGREVEESLEADMTSPDIILLDRQTRSKSAANHALEVFENAIAEATRATLEVHLN